MTPYWILNKNVKMQICWVCGTATSTLGFLMNLIRVRVNSCTEKKEKCMIMTYGFTHRCVSLCRSALLLPETPWGQLSESRQKTEICVCVCVYKAPRYEAFRAFVKSLGTLHPHTYMHMDTSVFSYICGVLCKTLRGFGAFKKAQNIGCFMKPLYRGNYMTPLMA